MLSYFQCERNPRGTSTMGQGSPCPGPFSHQQASLSRVLVEWEGRELQPCCLSRWPWLWPKEACLSAQPWRPSFLHAVALKISAKNVQMQNPRPLRKITLITLSTLQLEAGFATEVTLAGVDRDVQCSYLREARWFWPPSVLGMTDDGISEVGRWASLER